MPELCFLVLHCRRRNDIVFRVLSYGVAAWIDMLAMERDSVESSNYHEGQVDYLLVVGS